MILERTELESDSLNNMILNKENLSEVIIKTSTEMMSDNNYTLKNLNEGDCENFALEVLSNFFDDDLIESLFYREFNRVKLVTSYDYDEKLDDHVWIVFEDRHYDAEAPNGVDDYLDLPIYKRQFGNIKEHMIITKFESFINEKYKVKPDDKTLTKIVKSVNRSLPGLNNSGYGGCLTFAESMNSVFGYNIIHIFEESDEYDSDEDNYKGDKKSYKNLNRYYFYHSVLDMGKGKFLDSKGFSNKESLIKRLKLNNPIFVKDSDGSVSKFIKKTEDFTRNIDEEKIIKDIIKKESMVNETYTSDRNQIVNFINELDDKIVLYRGIFVRKGEKLNRKKLGIHWSLDEDFVDNMFHYDTFKLGGSLQDYKMYKVFVVVDKKYIDIESTIDKRLIKDSGHFWDELTGELIENPDKNFHPYSHEDEIILLKNVKYDEIDIEKIDDIDLGY